MNDNIIISLLEQDLYKFSMGQAVLHNFPRTIVTVEFKCRSNVNIAHLKDEVDKQLDYLCSLRFTEEELKYLSNIRYLSSDYIDYLRMLQLNRKYINTYIDNEGQLGIIAKGPWRDVIYFEIPCLAIVQELYMREQNIDIEYAKNALQEKITKFADAAYLGFKLSDFGLRRRYSGQWQDYVVKEFAKRIPNTFVGTSNVYLAMKHNLTPIGTFAHEWYMGIMGEACRVSEVQKVALETWAKEYRGELGIALSDIFGFNAFLKDFDKYFAKLFDGCRHDSGCPFKWGYMLIDHYKKLNIDPKTKTGVWSDSLNPDKAIELAKEFHDKIKVSFGIGTDLTNDMGVKPLSIVMKLTESNGHPVVKLSDSLGKCMCHDEQFIEYVKQQYNYKSIDEL